jgi:hypothetical protein
MTGLDDMEKWKFLTLRGLELRPFYRSANRQSLHRLRYRGSCSQTLREENGLRVFEDRMLREIFGSRRDEVTGGW